MRVSFVPLDLNSPLEEQHGGKFDAILHKMTEDILCKSQLKYSSLVRYDENETNNNSTSSSKSLSSTTATFTTTTTTTSFQNSEKEALKRIQRLLKYKQNYPACCLVDHPTNVEAVMSRSKIALTLTQCLRGVTTKSGIPVQTPRYLVLNDDDLDLDLDLDDDGKKNCSSSSRIYGKSNNYSHNCKKGRDKMIQRNEKNGHSNDKMHKMLKTKHRNHEREQLQEEDIDIPTNPSSKEITIAKQIEDAPFTYPLIIKPLTAAGTAESHRMGILLGRNGISKIHTPCLLQEYANHDGILYKVYVLGNRVWVFPRPSLPNLPIGELLSSNIPHYDDFDSQRPYPKTSDLLVLKDNSNENKQKSRMILRLNLIRKQKKLMKVM